MEKIYRVKTNEGYKEFTNEEEANAFEAELKLSKKELQNNEMFKLENKLSELNYQIRQFKRLTGLCVDVVFVDGNLRLHVYDIFELLERGTELSRLFKTNKCMFE